jgi:hypothetical protein
MDERNPVRNVNVNSGHRTGNRTIRRSLIRNSLCKCLRCSGVRTVEDIKRFESRGTCSWGGVGLNASDFKTGGRCAVEQGLGGAASSMNVKSLRLDGQGLLDLECVRRIRDSEVEFLQHGGEDKAVSRSVPPPSIEVSESYMTSCHANARPMQPRTPNPNYSIDCCKHLELRGETVTYRLPCIGLR